MKHLHRVTNAVFTFPDIFQEMFKRDEQLWAYSQMFSFFYVRHPFVRIVSAYQNLVRDKNFMVRSKKTIFYNILI